MQTATSRINLHEERLDDKVLLSPNPSRNILYLAQRVRLTDGGLGVDPLYLFKDSIGYRYGNREAITDHFSAQPFASPEEVVISLYLKECRRISGYGLPQSKMTLDGFVSFVYNERMPLPSIQDLVSAAFAYVHQHMQNDQRMPNTTSLVDYALGMLFAHRYAHVDLILPIGK